MAIGIRRLLSLLVLVWIMSAAGKFAAAQQPTASPTPSQKAEQQQEVIETLKIETNLVPLNVTVSDRAGRAITALKKEDFKVYENGVEQPVSYFSPEEAPASWGLVMDRSGSMMGMIGDVYRAALHIIDEGTEQDEMFIVTFNKRVEVVSDFTSDRHKLENSILGLEADGETALYDAVAFALDHIEGGKHKKRVLMVLTDGEDNSSHIKFRKLVERAEEEGVLIYTVGMFEGMDDRLLQMMRMGRRDARGELEKLAEVTGAHSHFPSDIEGCRNAMREIAREVSRQYSLGYYPINRVRDGKWRNIRVVAQGDGKTTYVARTRTGYYAPKN